MSTGKKSAIEASRQYLLQRSASLVTRNETDSLSLALHRFFPKLRHAFVLHWIPEQAEDIYWVLVSPTEIAEIEVPRGDYALESLPSLKLIDIGAYQQRRHSRDIRQKLEISLELLKNG
ncbi:hypothetical protein GCM10027093_33730 [Paraburkholderia jirisanensis]